MVYFRIVMFINTDVTAHNVILKYTFGTGFPISQSTICTVIKCRLRYWTYWTCAIPADNFEKCIVYILNVVCQQQKCQF